MPSPLAIFAVLTAEIAYATNPILTVTVTTIHQDFKNGKTFCKKRMQLHPLHPSTYSIKRTVCAVALRAIWCVSSIYNIYHIYHICGSNKSPASRARESIASRAPDSRKAKMYFREKLCVAAAFRYTAPSRCLR